ncbi:MAG: rhodanese-like domain-containing protein [Bdellovibrionales bacterium]|nr:rhodanese-like domain-containing protein [Bdellovibrionales bacterium]
MIKEINVDQLMAKITEKEKFHLIDVREQDEWNESHIEGASLIPKSTLPAGLNQFPSDLDATIILQCRSGKRSLDVGLMLLNEGYTDLYNLEGGILAWKEKGYPITQG